jgi:hypothetical protein
MWVLEFLERLAYSLGVPVEKLRIIFLSYLSTER